MPTLEEQKAALEKQLADVSRAVSEKINKRTKADQDFLAGVVRRMTGRACHVINMEETALVCRCVLQQLGLVPEDKVDES